MKILTLLNFFSTYLIASSINIEVRCIFLLHAVLDISPIGFYVEFYLSFNLQYRSYASLLCCHASYFGDEKVNAYIIIPPLVSQHNAGQFFSSGHTNNWAVLVSIH